MATTLTVNKQKITVEAAPDTPLLWVLRDHLQLTGTKYGCGIAQCGACTVHLDGEPIRSCSMPLSAAEGRAVTTIEGVDSAEARALQAAWESQAVYQCGYCQSGQLMSATRLLENNREPADQDIDAAMSGNICRCATYDRIRSGIKHAASELAKEVN